MVVASVGALADGALRERLADRAARAGRRLYVISGAIGGFDVMQTIALMGGAHAAIANEKAPASLEGAPYLAGRTLSETRRETVFDGPVGEAIEGFPKNVNVAVAAALAAGSRETRVVIDSVPGLAENRHRVSVWNETVRAEIDISSRPDPENPKSSTMAAWSAAALLRSLASPIVLY